MDTQELVDVNTAARITGLDKTTIYRLARERRVRSFKVMGTVVRFERTDLMKLVEERPSEYMKVS